MAKLIEVGLILALACCPALLTEGAPEGTTPLVDEWLTKYGDVFTEIRPQIPTLTYDEIIERMEFMRSNIDQVRDNERIKEHMIHAVNMWYSAIMDKDPSHCSIHHFNYIKYELNSIINMRVPPTNSKDRLFEMFYNNIGNFCRTVLADSLGNSLDDQAINNLRNIKNSLELFFGSGNMTIRSLSRQVFGQLNFPRTSTREEIIDMWGHGPCSQLQQVIGLPDNRVNYQLLRQQDLRDQIGLNPEQETIDLCFRLERVCHQIDMMVDEMADVYILVRGQLAR